MKRLLRIIFNGLTLLTLLLCAWTGGLWVRSCWISDSWNWDGCTANTLWDIEVITGDGFAHASFTPERIPTDADPKIRDEIQQIYRSMLRGFHRITYPYPMPQELGPRRLEAEYYHETGQVFVTFSLWHAISVFAILPAIWIWQMMRRRCNTRNNRDNLCLTCGYDLRATPDRCPECGSVPATAGQ